MTTRDEARRATGEVRADTSRSSAPVESVPSLPERLYAARERKGVDLYRAERDTKIRARYLAALERGDYRELPGAVYTKGFLRNYALYLGLEPEEILTQWRRERGDMGPPAAGHRRAAAARRAAPRPDVLAGRHRRRAADGRGPARRRVPGGPGHAVRQAADPRGDRSQGRDADGRRGRRRPTCCAGRRSRAERSPSRSPALPRQTSADSTGAWSLEVDLRRGKNQFKIDATDPETGKHAEQTAQVVITVPSAEIEVPTLTVDQPADGATFENGAIPVQGMTTNATSVTVKATYDGPVDGAPVVAGASAAARCRARSRVPVDDGRVVQHAAPADDRPLVDHRHGVRRGQQDRLAHPPRHRRLQGRQPRGRGQGRHRPGSRSGSTASSRRRRVAPATRSEAARP